MVASVTMWRVGEPVQLVGPQAEAVERLEQPAQAAEHTELPALGEPAGENLEGGPRDRRGRPQGGVEHGELVLVRVQRGRGAQSDGVSGVPPATGRRARSSARRHPGPRWAPADAPARGGPQAIGPQRLALGGRRAVAGGRRPATAAGRPGPGCGPGPGRAGRSPRCGRRRPPSLCRPSPLPHAGADPSGGPGAGTEPGGGAVVLVAGQRRQRRLGRRGRRPAPRPPRGPGTGHARAVEQAEPGAVRPRRVRRS